jgi:transaldolase/glucose-6-phosphate isomerase
VPVDGEVLGAPDVYSHDRVFVSMQLAGGAKATTAKQLAALEAAGHPVVRINIPDAMAVGGEFFRWPVATVLIG